MAMLILVAHHSLAERCTEHDMRRRTSLLVLSACGKLLQIALTRKEESEKTHPFIDTSLIHTQKYEVII
jgi:hypothetical protein